MTKLDWDKARRAAQMSRPYDLPHGGRRIKLKALGFPSKYPGTCANCKVRFPKGTLMRYNALRQVVHGRGCPKKSKPSKRSPLAQ